MPTLITEIEWSSRANKALLFAGIETLEQLCACSLTQVLNFQFSGVTTARELLRGCLSQYVKPEWLRDAAKLRTNAESSAPAGFERIAGPYSREERPMMEVCTATLWPIDYRIVQGVDGLHVYRSASGFIKLGAEEE